MRACSGRRMALTPNPTNVVAIARAIKRRTTKRERKILSCQASLMSDVCVVSAVACSFQGLERRKGSQCSLRSHGKDKNSGDFYIRPEDSIDICKML